MTEVKKSKLSDDESQSESEESQGIVTDLRGIRIASLVMFIAAIENTVVGMSEWPYMNQIDKEADAQFFGTATAASKLFHALSALVFAVWCHRYQSFKRPLYAGRFIAFAACILYLGVEMFDSGRRYVMALCYILFGIAASSSTILRAYVAAISTHADRPKAYSGLNAATMISIIVGPVIQAIFWWCPYPGYKIFGNVKFHIYSAPIWVAALTNFVSVAIICCLFEELPSRAQSHMKKHQSFLTFSGIKSRFEKLSEKKLDWQIIVLCWIQKMASSLSIVTLTTLTSVIFMTNYGWSGNQTVIAMSVTLAAVGVLAVLITSLYFFHNLGNYLQQRFAFLIGLSIFISMYVFSYPYPKWANPVPAYNATADLGCNPSVYQWCETASAPPAALLLIVIAAVMGIGIPLSFIALDAIYSKALGPINQSVMQGAMIVAEDIVLIAGPIYSSGVYTHFGLETLWKLNGIIVAIGTILWLAHFCKLKKYS